MVENQESRTKSQDKKWWRLSISNANYFSWLLVLDSWFFFTFSTAKINYFF